MGQENQSTMPENPALSGSALRRKVATGQAEHQARAMSLPKALRLTIGKVADGLFDLAMATISLRVSDVAGEELDQAFLDQGLLILLDGPHGRRAAAVLDGPLVGALVQQQTMGQVLANDDGDDRKLTTTDAAMCAPFLDGVLQGVEGLPEDPVEEKLVNGYRFGARADDLRQLKLALSAARYRIVHTALDIAAGTQQGQMMLCFPTREDDEDGNDQADTPSREAGDGALSRPGRQRLGDTVLALHADLLVALAQVKLPLHRLGALKPGDELELHACNFEKVDILTRDGRQIGNGALGQVEGTRAVQVAHETSGQTTPKRRASDRDDLDQPEVVGAATLPDEQRREDDNEGIVSDAAALSDHSGLLQDAPRLGQADAVEPLPDMSDLPELADTALAVAG